MKPLDATFSAVALVRSVFELNFIPHNMSAGSFVALLRHACKTSPADGRRPAEHVCVAVNESHHNTV